MKTIYFVRHASTPGNEGNAYQHPELSLSETGIKQAHVLAKRFETIPVDIALSSDMARAFETAEIISKHNKIPLEKNPIFREISRPSIVRGKSVDDPEVNKIMREIKAKYEDLKWRHSDEENFLDLRERAEGALQYIRERKEERILIVTHGSFLRMITGLILFEESMSPTIFKKFIRNAYTANTGITMFGTYEDRFTLKTWNDHEHLGEIK